MSNGFCTRRQAFTVALLVFVLGAQRTSVTGAAPLVFLYEDDFETEKAKTDSYSHAQFLDRGRPPPGATYLANVHYPLRGGGDLNNVLYFVAGENPPGAWLGYHALPSGASALGGSVQFDRPNPMDAMLLSVRLSDDGINWTTLAESRGGQPVGRHIFVVPAGAPSQFLELRGGGMIDNLRISISYVPEPGVSLALPGLPAFTLRRCRRRSSVRSRPSAAG